MLTASGQFVLLRHVGHGPSHWDLMLEGADALATWRLTRFPESNQPYRETIERIGDHRKAYLTYEGPVSGDRGFVTRADGGGMMVLNQTEDGLLIELSGRRLRGRFRLERQPGGRDMWSIERETAQNAGSCH